MERRGLAGEERLRHGWLFGAMWLVYLGDPLGALTSHSAGRARDLALVALAAFAAAYLYVQQDLRWIRLGGKRTSLPRRCAQVALLLALTALLVPGAHEHALAALVFVSSTVMMALPVRPAVGVVAGLFVTAEALPYAVPGWHDGGYGLGVLLAAVAVWGIRLAFERNAHLREAQDELARLAVEQERARIAGDLHDILGHSLTVVTLKAELARRMLDVDPERARAELADLEALSRDALADVRSTALGVRGVSLPGEIATAREVLAAAGVQAELPTAADEVPTPWRELFAWTIREAVTNLVRHSGASYCEVRLTPASVEVLDDGAGTTSGSGSGQGLPGLRRRAEALGARLSCGDRYDAPGFHVRVKVPS